MTSAGTARPYLDRGPGSGNGLAEVIDIILDKGLVIDAYVRVSAVGIEILTIDARIVVASVDTYLRFAQAVNRMDIASQEGGLPDLLNKGMESGAKDKTKGALEGIRDAVTGDGKGEDEEQPKGEKGGSQGATRGGARR